MNSTAMLVMNGVNVQYELKESIPCLFLTAGDEDD